MSLIVSFRVDILASYWLIKIIIRYICIQLSLILINQISISDIKISISEIIIKYHGISISDIDRYQYKISLDITTRQTSISNINRYQWILTSEINIRQQQRRLLSKSQESIYGIEKINTGETTSWQIFDIYNHKLLNHLVSQKRQGVNFL